MRFSQSPSAKKYAQAYISEYGSVLTLQDVEHIKYALSFLRQHHNFMSLISVLNAREQERLGILDEMLEHFSLPSGFKKLIDVLITHKKLVLFAPVIQDICCLYLRMHNIIELSIVSAAPLTQQQQKSFEQFFMKLSKKQIISRITVDEALIAGIRMQSDIFMWEYSISARIRKLSQQMLQEE